MKIAVMSDTHGNVQLAVNALKHIGKIDRLIHLGDHYSDALQIGNKTGIPVDGVSGNTDLNSEPWADREKTLQLNGIRVFITHGDLYKVKHGIDLLIEKAIIEDAHIVLFGHTHFPMKQRIGDILFLNPGCVLSNNANKSLALLNLSNNRVEAEIIHI
ncbi:MAG: manganese/nickel-dependent phosphodiesterase, YfcE family [Deltaproteobacteria bacterium]|nr:manganese/nickel-dependent phosphodiesterase, YfcE family [Deltaproteobacteria bacterium]